MATETFQVIRHSSPADPNDRGRDQGLVLFNGQLVCNWSPEQMNIIAGQMKALASEIMNDRNAEKQAFDWAILRRIGWRIGLSDNKATSDKAIQLSQWDSTIRKNLPNTGVAIKSTEKFGKPIIQNPGPKVIEDATV